MSAKHTLGPWSVAETRLNYDSVIRGPNKEPITLVQIAGYSKSEGRANSVLIAAAPTILEELKKITRHFLTTSDPEVAALVRSSLAVIAKAVGEAP